VATPNKKYNNLLGLPRKQHDARPQGQAPLAASLHDALTIDLRQKINDGRDAWRIIDGRRKDHPDRYHHNDDNDRFPAFTSNLTEKSYLKDFKPVEIPMYDGKQDPRQWIRYYSIAIEVTGGSNSIKALYFSVALESTPLTWLESLKPNSIDSWEDLKRAFIDNFQRSMIRAGLSPAGVGASGHPSSVHATGRAASTPPASAPLAMRLLRHPPAPPA
jgi:hypothetical protein